MNEETRNTDLTGQNSQSAANPSNIAATNDIPPASDQVKPLQNNELQSSKESLTDQPDGNKASKGKKKKKNKNKAGQTEQSNDKMSESAAGDQQAVDSPVSSDQTEPANDNVNVSIENKPLENIIQIDTSAANLDGLISASDANDNQSERPATVEVKASAEEEEETKESINEATKLLADNKEPSKQTNGHLEKRQNGKPSSTSSSNADVYEGIPELLLTENNRPNNSGITGKLIVAAILLFKFITYFIIQLIGLFHPAKRNRLPPINEPLLLLSAAQITEKIKNGELKCEHVITAYIHRIETVQPKLNAVIDDCFAEAITRAKEIDEQLKDPKLAAELKKLPLLGVPFTCKDSISIKGLALTAGVKIRKGIKADEDAPVISNLRKAGAIPLCLTNTPELVLWYDSDNNLYGRTNNPYDLSRIVGGSSGGEGCLISAAGSLMGVGSDVAGSIRIPSMFCGTFGHKTIKKYVPVDGMFPKPPETYGTFFCFGPIARYASDLPIILSAMSGGAADELRLDEPVDFKKIKKIYYMEQIDNPLASFVDQRILNAMQKAIKHFKDEYGVQAEQININKFKFSLAFFGTACVKGEMKIEDFVSRTGKVNVYLELFKSIFGKSDITRPILIQIINQSSPYCDPNSKSYARFVKMLEELKPKVHDLLSDNAVLIMPTWPTLAPKHQTTILRGFDAAYTTIMNALEVCATHCPMGFLTKSEGLPIGFSVAAGPGQDRISIAFAKEIERKFGGWVPPPGHA